MKKLFILIFLSVTIIGCDSKKENPKTPADKFAFDTTAINTTAVDNPDRLVDLSYKLEKGKTYKYRLTTITKSLQTIKTDTTIVQDVIQKLSYITNLKAVDVDKSGIMEIEFTFSNIKLDAQANGNYFIYESGVTKDSSEILKYADYEAMIDNPFTARIDKKGNLQEIFRTDRILNKLLEIQGYQDSLNTAQINELKVNLEEGVLKPLIFQVFRQLPAQNVAKDSTWEFPKPASRFMVFVMQNTNTFEVSSLSKFESDELVLIEDGMKTNITGDNKYSENNVTYLFNKPTTEANGKMYFNLTKGYVQKGKRYTKLNLYFTMEAKNGKLIQKGSKDSVIENTYIVEKL